jgi:hypothetical protein
MITEFTHPIIAHANLQLKVENGHSLIEYAEGIATIIHHLDYNTLIDVQNVMENLNTINKLSNQSISPILIDFSGFTHTNPLYSPTARNVLFGQEWTKKRSAIAFLFSSEDQIKKAFLFHSDNKHDIPLKMFVHREEALDWLKSFVLN